MKTQTHFIYRNKDGDLVCIFHLREDPDMYFDVTSETLYLRFSSVAEKKLREFLIGSTESIDDYEKLAEVMKEIQPNLSDKEIEDLLASRTVVVLLRKIKALVSALEEAFNALGDPLVIALAHAIKKTKIEEEQRAEQSDEESDD